MKVVEVETLEPTRMRLHIEIPAEELQAELDKTYSNLQRTVQIPGFRRQKVPRRVIVARYRKAVEEEVLHDLVPAACQEAIEERELDVVGGAKLDPPLEEMSIPEEGDLRFALEVEVKPPLALPDLRVLEVDKTAVDVTQEEVDEYIDQIRQARATVEDVEEERAAEEGDVVFVDWSVRKPGAEEPVVEQEDYSIEIGEGRVWPEMEEALRGMRPGETKTISITYPDDYPNEDLRGQTTDLTLTLKRIGKKIVPELNDAFAKSLNYEDVAAMRAAYWNRLIEMKKSEKRAQQERELLDQLIEKVPFDVPEETVREEQRRLLMYRLQQLERLGQNVNEVDIESLSEELREAAERNVRERWILDAIADEFEIDVDDDEVMAYLDERAEARGEDREKLEARIRALDQMEAYERVVRDRKIFDLLIERASQKPTIVTP